MGALLPVTARREERFTDWRVTPETLGDVGRIAEGLIDETAWHGGIKDLYRTAGDGGTFCYTFFKALAKE